MTELHKEKHEIESVTAAYLVTLKYSRRALIQLTVFNFKIVFLIFPREHTISNSKGTLQRAERPCYKGKEIYNLGGRR